MIKLLNLAKKALPLLNNQAQQILSQGRTKEESNILLNEHHPKFQHVLKQLTSNDIDKKNT